MWGLPSGTGVGTNSSSTSAAILYYSNAACPVREWDFNQTIPSGQCVQIDEWTYVELAVKEYDGWEYPTGSLQCTSTAHLHSLVLALLVSHHRFGIGLDGGYCAENEIRSIMMGSDSNFDVNTTTFHVEPEGECLGEDENIMYICSPDGSMMYIWEFSESGCLGSYEVKQNASSPVDFGNGTYAACHCSPDRQLCACKALRGFELHDIALTVALPILL